MTFAKDSTEYLYGVEPKEFSDMIYKDAIRFKHEKAQELYRMLYMRGPVKSEEDALREFYVEKAMAHTKMLMDELV